MADPLPTRLHIDPPIDQWQVTPRNGRSQPIIATGHQPTLWHPGILAKDLAADAYAKLVGGTAMHVVVEHNPIDTHSLDVPRQAESVLLVRRCQLTGRLGNQALPPNTLSPIDVGLACNTLEQEATNAADGASFLSDGLRDLAKAFASAGDEQPDHAQQMADVLDLLKQPYLHQRMSMLATRDLVTQGFLERLLADPLGCVRCYNRAARAYPEAGVRPLYAGRDVVEAPLWAQGNGPCTPVYIDLGDSAKPLLFTQGQSLDLIGNDALKYLRPRAISLSAIMRSELCDLFIHGTGGGVYDQVTERWWHDWAGEDLAPKAVVSADVYLPFDVQLATAEEYRKAQWFAHHLPHNLDRQAVINGDGIAAVIAEKQDLLDRMNDDRDKRRRARAFQRIHAINAELRAQHTALLQQAQQRAEAMRIGLGNAVIARKRDWCFALYSEQQIHELAEQVNARLTALPG